MRKATDPERLVQALTLVAVGYVNSSMKEVAKDAIRMANKKRIRRRAGREGRPINIRGTFDSAMEGVSDPDDKDNYCDHKKDEKQGGG